MEEMKSRVLILGGTSEGRELSRFAHEIGLSATVSVVSGYGGDLLEETRYVKVHQGALDREEMERFFERMRPELVLDATHPYARQVTEQAKELCGIMNIPYSRVIRDSQNQNGKGIFHADGAEQAVEILKQDSRPVFLTTGSKELGIFASAAHLKGRLIARVLPDSRVIKSCEDMGIRGPSLIAMQGPFSVEMNRAMLKSTGAGWLVTKESGSRGGFAEKLQAAQECGVSVIVLDRPVQEDGISVEEARAQMQILAGKAGCTFTEPSEEKDYLKEGEASGKKELFLIGMGMGGAGQLTLEAKKALESCQILFGAPRMLRDVAALAPGAEKVSVYLAEDIRDWLKTHRGQNESFRAAAVYSGDTGFYSGSRQLLELWKREEANWQVRVFPGISSVSALCAELKTSWEDLYLTSAHGRDCDPSALLEQHKRVFLLLGGKDPLAGLCRRLTEAGWGHAGVRAGICLGYDNQQLIQDRADRLLRVQAEGLVSVILEREWSDGTYEG